MARTTGRPVSSGVTIDPIVFGIFLTAVVTGGVGIASWALVLLVRVSSLVSQLESRSERSEERLHDHEARLRTMENHTQVGPNVARQTHHVNTEYRNDEDR